MKKNRIFGLAAAALLLSAGACSNDMLVQDPDKVDAEAPVDGVYLAVNFDLPSAKETRSFTDGENSSNDGTEIGRDYENSVTSAFIVLTKTDNSFIAAAESETLDPVGTTGRSYRNTAKFTKTDLAQFYQSTLTEDDKDSSTGNYKVNVYVFANPTDGLTTLLKGLEFGDTEWVDAKGVCDVLDEGNNKGIIWGENKFLMSNTTVCTRLFPSNMAEWDNFNKETSPFNLSGMNNFGRPNEIDNLTNAGNIYVERAAARYDFRDGALDGLDDQGNYKNDENFNGFKAQTYHVVLDTDSKPLVDVYLGKMSMVNMNKEYYFLRRVSNDGMPGGEGYKLLGPELPWYTNASGSLITDQSGNYIVDAFAEWKSKNATSGFEDHFNYPFFTEEGVMDNVETSSDRWYTSLISSVLDGKPDSWNTKEGEEGRYHTWRYLTEGTIPGIESQQNGVSNGIVFKGQLQPAREAIVNGENADDEFTQKLLKALEVSEDGNKLHDPILYVFGGHVYCTWEHIKRMAIYLSLTDLKWNEEQNKWDFSINRSTTLYNAVFGTGGFGSVTFTCEKNGVLKNANFLKPGDETLTDVVSESEKSANYLYNEWKKEFPGSDEEVGDGDADEMEYFEAFRDAAVAKNIALYQTSYDEELGGWGYYCYYYYWNRHNDNGQVGIMGPMEFAVVRNNVYKLAVTKIARLGHPRISANDPDKPTPNTPDEKGDVYISVTCTTLPWVVRENTIEF